MASSEKAENKKMEQTNLGHEESEQNLGIKTLNMKSATQPEHQESPSAFNIQQSRVEVKKDKKINQLMIQNKRLRIGNKELKRQLQIFEKRLDESLKKRTVSQKKPRVTKQLIQSMQLKNAYKQCQIYKRQINKMKKKEEMYNQQKIQQMHNRIVQHQIDKLKYQQEIRSLKLQNKQLEKALVELTGNGNFKKMLKEFEEVKQENRKLMEKLNKQGRQTKLKEMSDHNEKRKVKQAQIKDTQLKKKDEEKQTSQLEILKSKTDKDSKKIVYLTAENNKLEQAVAEYKGELEQKDKQIQALRKRLAVLRKQTKLTTNSRIYKQPQPDNHQTPQQSIPRKTHSRIKSEQSPTTTTQQKSTQSKYPRLQQSGDKKQNSYKWNHHQYSSKIKQISVILHPNGYINDINIRYQKGQPQKNDSKGNKSTFICEEYGGEYVRKIMGGFKDGVLRYLGVESSQGRVERFGQYELEKQCVGFCFGGADNEYPGAMLGENTIEGINRIGCLIQTTTK